MDFTAAIAKHSAVCDVAAQRVLETVLQLGKKLRCVEKFGSLQIAEQTPQHLIGKPAYRTQQAERHVLSNDRSFLEEALLGIGKCVDARGENRLQCGRNFAAREVPRNMVAAACALENTSINQRSYDL